MAMAEDRSLSSLRSAIRDLSFADEGDRIRLLAEEQGACRYDRERVSDLAARLIAAERKKSPTSGVGITRLMREFSLSTAEGVALMCLAEALLRIPDQATVDRLIRDKLGHGDWSAHVGHAHSLFVNATAWGLMVTGRIVRADAEGGFGPVLTRLLRRGGEPLIRTAMDFAMRLLGDQFVMGETIAAALARARRNEAVGYRHSFDMLGEAALTDRDAGNYFAAYERAIAAIGEASGGRGPIDGPGISIKLSALHPRYQESQRARVMEELRHRLKLLMGLAADFGIGLNIDAEESWRLELSLDLFESLAVDPDLAGWDGMGFVVQAYQKRAPAVVDWLIALARRESRRFLVRLVKGAYWDSEVKRAQVEGLPNYPVYTRKAHTDLAYLVCADRLLAAADAIFPQFATHNAHTLASVYEMAVDRQVSAYEFQCLHGMGEPLYDQIVGKQRLNRPCRIYAPVGTHSTLLPYLVRRLLENGANSSFVNRLADEAVSTAQLIQEPLGRTRQTGFSAHPDLPLPAKLYGKQRPNSAGVELSDPLSREQIAQGLARFESVTWHAQPLIADGSAKPVETLEVRSPSDRRIVVGRVVQADSTAIEAALARAAAGASDWAAQPPGRRAEMLLAAADRFETHRDELVSLCVREAGKTWANALGEIREAVDFCRYYASQLQREGDGLAGDGVETRALPLRPPTREPPGPAVCISPWNFPLAIFVGQISAALAAGSPVIAKPAEQTTLTAYRAIELMREAGIPAYALQFLPGRGETVGAALVADSRVKTVLFTGSTEVARRIHIATSVRPGVKLVAETGGQNAMIADSTALAEQLVQDALQSGFDSAGQRCSALRVLCLQEEIADSVIELLKGAMRELRIGDPAQFSTDIGPVIDDGARVRLQRHLESMRDRGCEITRADLPEGLEHGSFFAPAVVEIDWLDAVPREVFGPIIHVVRYSADQLDQLIESVNGLGYGLTMGVHSRIDDTVDRIVDRARVGNLYVNRNMIGAVVGVQPFGGEGLSGTGPKAGGPLTLPSLAGEPQVLPGQLSLTAPVARPAAESDALQMLREWAEADGRLELAAQCDWLASATLLNRELSLPGPTGESNTLCFRPRGTVLCKASSEDSWLTQLATVFATGNRPSAWSRCRRPGLIGTMPPLLADAIDWREDGDFARLAAILCEQHDPQLATELATAVAGVNGALVPLIVRDASGRYPLYRLLTERLVCVNTAASGGNAALMSLEG